MSRGAPSRPPSRHRPSWSKIPAPKSSVRRRSRSPSHAGLTVSGASGTPCRPSSLSPTPRSSSGTLLTGGRRCGMRAEQAADVARARVAREKEDAANAVRLANDAKAEEIRRAHAAANPRPVEPEPEVIRDAVVKDLRDAVAEGLVGHLEVGPNYLGSLIDLAFGTGAYARADRQAAAGVFLVDRLASAVGEVYRPRRAVYRVDPCPNSSLIEMWGLKHEARISARDCCPRRSAIWHNATTHERAKTKTTAMTTAGRSQAVISMVQAGSLGLCMLSRLRSQRTSPAAVPGKWNRTVSRQEVRPRAQPKPDC